MSVIDSPIPVSEPAGLFPQARRHDQGPAFSIGQADRPSFADLLERQRRVDRPDGPSAVEQRAANSTEQPKRSEEVDREASDRGETAAPADRPQRQEAAANQANDSEPQVDEPVQDEPVSNDADGDAVPAESVEDAGLDAVPLALQSALQPTTQLAADATSPSNPQAATAASVATQSAAASGQAIPTQPANPAQPGTPGIAIVEQAGLAPQAPAQAQTGADTQGEGSGKEQRADTQAKPLVLSEAGAVAKTTANAASAQPVASTEAPPAGTNTQPTARIAAPAAANTAPPQQPTDAGADPNIARVSRGLSSAIAQRGGSVTLRLTPADMGTVRIQMQMTGTTLSASFHAESASAQSLLTQQLSSLRQSLEGQGLQVERLTVQSMQAAPSQQGQSGSNTGGQHQQDTASQQQSANDGRSRGQYTGQQGGSRRDPQSGEAPRGFSDHFNPQGAADAA